MLRALAIIAACSLVVGLCLGAGANILAWVASGARIVFQLLFGVSA